MLLFGDSGDDLMMGVGCDLFFCHSCLLGRLFFLYSSPTLQSIDEFWWQRWRSERMRPHSPVLWCSTPEYCHISRTTTITPNNPLGGLSRNSGHSLLRTAQWGAITTSFFPPQNVNTSSSTISFAMEVKGRLLTALQQRFTAPKIQFLYPVCQQKTDPAVPLLATPTRTRSSRHIQTPSSTPRPTQCSYDIHIHTWRCDHLPPTLLVLSSNKNKQEKKKQKKQKQFNNNNSGNNFNQSKGQKEQTRIQTNDLHSTPHHIYICTNRASQSCASTSICLLFMSFWWQRWRFEDNCAPIGLMLQCLPYNVIAPE